MGACTPTLDETDFDRITPERLDDVVDYDLLLANKTVRHRGHDVDAERLLGRLGAALDQEAVEQGETSAPSNLPESVAVDVVLDGILRRAPRWFDWGTSLDKYDQTVSEQHLSQAALRERYWQGRPDSETMPVAGGDWADQLRVIVPILALVWEQMLEQQRADRRETVAAAKGRIRRTIRREVRENDLAPHTVEAAVGEAFTRL
jgi:hypothetical protein